MRITEWLKKALAPAKLTSTTPIVREKPLYEQHQRIGGGITPSQVSEILRAADGGQPMQLCDLMGETRQKDGHMQGALGSREMAVSLTGLDFVAPPDPSSKEREAVSLCRRIRDDFGNWQTMVEHLIGQVHGHGTCAIKWEMSSDGLLLPVSAAPLYQREFIFALSNGALRYARTGFDTEGVDILADNPGRIVQVQRRIVGDVQAREGLIRILVWSGLFRNWSLKDWLALGEIGWKPWRLATYAEGTDQADVDRLTAMLERVGSTGVAVTQDGQDIKVEWPKGGSLGGGSAHREFYEAIGREISKAVLGQTTSIESGPNGTRGDTQSRDEVRADIREADCRAVAAALRAHMFAFAVQVNLGQDVRCPVPMFQTEDRADLLEFSQAVKFLQGAGCRIPAKWVRDEAGMPEPTDGEEVLALPQPKPAAGGSPDDDAIDVEIEDDEDDSPA